MGLIRSKSVLIPLGNGKKLEIITGQYGEDIIKSDGGWFRTDRNYIIDTQLSKIDQITGLASLASIVGSKDLGFAIDSTTASWLGDQNKIQLALTLAVSNGTIIRIDFQILAYGE